VNSMFLALIAANEGAAKEKDSNGTLLLHGAIDVKLDSRIIHALLEANEEASLQKE
jgi:hypothetical protein